MADEQTGDFFAGMEETPPPVPTEQSPPAEGFDDNDFMMDFASSVTPAMAPPPPPENYIGDVVEDVTENATAGNPFAMPASDEPIVPVESNYDEPIILGEPSQYEQPPEADFAAPAYEYDAPAPTDFAAPIILGEAPPSEFVEDDLPAPTPEEPSPLAKWNEQWQVTLRERKDAENALKADQVNTGRAETDAFLEERSIKLSSRQSSNRTAEEEKLKSMQEDLESDNSWQRVVKLVELTQDSVEKSAEIKRMRDMLILLKNDKERAVLLC